MSLLEAREKAFCHRQPLEFAKAQHRALGRLRALARAKARASVPGSRAKATRYRGRPRRLRSCRGAGLARAKPSRAVPPVRPGALLRGATGSGAAREPRPWRAPRLPDARHETLTLARAKAGKRLAQHRPGTRAASPRGSSARSRPILARAKALRRETAELEALTLDGGQQRRHDLPGNTNRGAREGPLQGAPRGAPPWRAAGCAPIAWRVDQERNIVIGPVAG